MGSRGLCDGVRSRRAAHRSRANIPVVADVDMTMRMRAGPDDPSGSTRSMRQAAVSMIVHGSAMRAKSPMNPPAENP